MSTNIYVPYSYVLFHFPTNKRYYGIQYGKNANPKNLWNTYYTSSKIVHALIDKYGKDSFSVQVRKIFKNKKQALLWEQKFLTKIDAKNNIMWINQHNGNGNFLNSGGYSQKKSAIEKRSGKNHYTFKLGYSPQKGKICRTKEQKMKYSRSKIGKNNPRSTSCCLYDHHNNIVSHFNTKKEAYEYFIEKEMPLTLLTYKIYTPTKFNSFNKKYEHFVGFILKRC